MGRYRLIVNLDKREYVDPGPFGAGGIHAACRDGRFRDISADIRPPVAAALGAVYVNTPIRLAGRDGGTETLDCWRAVRDPEAPFSVLPAPKDAP